MFGFVSYAEECGVYNGYNLGGNREPCCQIDDINEPECEGESVCDPSNARCDTGMSCIYSGDDISNGYYYYACVDPNAVCGGSGEFCCLGEGVERCDSADLECVYDYDPAVNDYICKTNHCGLDGERCCTVGDQCETGLTCIHQLDDPQYVCGNLTDYRTSCHDEGDVCCYSWFTADPSSINLCKTLNIGGNPLSPTWSACYCYNGLEKSFTVDSCYCQGETCGTREGYPCCLPADPALPPYCNTSEKLVCKVGPNTCCKDENGDLACDFACGGYGELCCQRSNPGLGEDEFYCESDDLECVNGYCGAGEVPSPPSLVYNGPIIDTLEKIIGPVAKMLYYGGLSIGVFFIILSGYRIMVSEGDPQRTKAAQEQLTSAIIGIIFILLSVTIIRIIIDSII